MADIVYSTVNLPNGVVGVPYEAAIAYGGNATVLTAGSISSGSLPPGLSLDPVNFVRITGTPLVDGLYTFKVTLTDTAGAAQTGNLTIRVVTPGIDDRLNYGAVSYIRLQWPLN